MFEADSASSAFGSGNSSPLPIAHAWPRLNPEQASMSILPRLLECVLPDFCSVAYDINIGSRRLIGFNRETAALPAHMSLKPAALPAFRPIPFSLCKQGVIRFTNVRAPLAFGANGGRKSGAARAPRRTFMHGVATGAAARKAHQRQGRPTARRPMSLV